MKKILFSDLDGTLLDPHCNISRENLEALDELAAREILLVPTSGRCYDEIPEVLKKHPAIAEVITSNGATTVHSKSGKTVASFPLTREEHLFLLDLLKKEPSAELFHRNGSVYIDAEKWAHYRDFGIVEYVYGALTPNIMLYDAKTCDMRETVEELAMSVGFFGDRAKLAKYTELLEADGRFSVTLSSAGGVEVMHRGVTKGTALTRIAELYGISRENTVAVGDHHNDIPMLQAAGIGLAVGNAEDAVKEAADRTICRNSEHILPYILEHIL